MGAIRSFSDDNGERQLVLPRKKDPHGNSDKGYDAISVITSFDGDGPSSSSSSSSSPSPSPSTVSSPTETDVDPKEMLGRVSLPLMTLCLAIGAGLPSLDTSICFTVMNEIGTEFQSAHLAAWIHSSYVLCCLTTLPLAGKLADVFGRRPVLIALTLFFLAGSYGCGAAQNFTQIIIARAIAGFGGGGCFLMSNVIIHDVVPLKQRSQYQSYISIVQTLGLALGSPIGGFITDTFGWRYCFKINILPLLFNATIYLFRLNNYRAKGMKLAQEPSSTWASLRSIDFTGALLLAIGNLTFAIGFLLGGNSRPWSDLLIVGVLITSVASFVGFGLYETYGASNPLVSHVLTSNRNVVSACLGMFLTCCSEGGQTFLLPQFLMGVLGFSTTLSGLWTMVASLSVPIGCFAAGLSIRHTGYFRTLAIACGVGYTLGFAVMSLWMVNKIPFALGATLMAVQGFAFGAIIVTLFMAVASDIAGSEVASAMSMVVMSRYMAYVLGVAVVSAIVQGNLKTLLYERISGPDADTLIQFIRTSIREVRSLSPELQDIVSDVLGHALQKGFFFMTGSMFLATLVFFCMKNINLRSVVH